MRGIAVPRRGKEEEVQERNVLVTDVDSRRLQTLIEAVRQREVRDAGRLALLEQHLDEAEVTPAAEIGPDVVTMNSEVRVTDLVTGESLQFRLVYPRVAATAAGTVSVLAPLGLAVLGRRVGEWITWEAPGGTRRIRVDDVLYQPEREGADVT